MLAVIVNGDYEDAYIYVLKIWYDGNIVLLCYSYFRMMSECVKIGEGVYGEVFRSVSRGQGVAIKVMIRIQASCSWKCH